MTKTDVALVFLMLFIVLTAIAEASEFRCRVCWRGFAVFTDRRCRRCRVRRIHV